MTAVNHTTSPLQAARFDRRLTQGELANAVGVTAGTIGRYERGEQKPRVKVLLALSEALGVPVRELYAQWAPQGW